MTEQVFLTLCCSSVIGLLALNYIAVTIQERRQGVAPVPFDPSQIDMDAIADPEVQVSLANGNKINAIRRYRQLTKAGLKQAKDVIDYVVKHPDDAAPRKNKQGAAPIDEGIRDLIREGKIEDAVYAYHLFTGLSEAEARIEIDRLSWEESHHKGASS